MGLKDIELKNIELEKEEASEEAKQVSASLINPPLFDGIEEIVPLLALQEVDGPPLDDESGLVKCCRAYTKFCYLFFNYISIIVYPFAVCLKECIRFCGFCNYYFCVVPSRYVATFCWHPCLDSIYRCVKPPLVCFVLFFRPCIAIMGDCCHACWDPCCKGK
uniref:Uncharacterized protein n=1 Tax=Palpitomonas bilix TaxID=652834 RepID=A0A7S3D2T2_9EUKA